MFIGTNTYVMIKYTIIPGCLVADAERCDVIKSMMNKSVTDMRWYGNSTNVVHLGHLINRLDEIHPLIVEELAERGFKYVGDGKVDGITGSERLDKAFSDDGGPVKQDCSGDDRIRGIVREEFERLRGKVVDGGPVKQDCSCDDSDEVASARFNTMESLMLNYCRTKMRQFDNMYQGMMATVKYNDKLEHPIPRERLNLVIDSAAHAELAREREDGRRRADEIRRNMKPDGRVMTAISKSHGSLEHRIRKLELWVEGFTAAGPLSKEAAD